MTMQERGRQDKTRGAAGSRFKSKNFLISQRRNIHVHPRIQSRCAVSAGTRVALVSKIFRVIPYKNRGHGAEPRAE